MPQYQGVWTLPVAARLQSTQQWATDPLYRNTTLLLQADNAPGGAQNNTFLDSSANNFTITRNGNTTQGTFTPFSATGWSNFLNGDYLTGSTNLFSTTISTFTIEAWLYPTALNSALGENIIIGDQDPIGATLTLSSYINNSGQVVLGWYDGTSKNCVSVDAINLNQWSYVAIVVNSNAISMYVNKTTASSLTGTTTLTNRTQTNNFTIGQYAASFRTARWVGYLSNIRVSTVARSISSIPTAPYTSDANTRLLTCQSNRFVDNSSNGFTLTPAGTPSVQAFSPFAPQFQWTAPVIGGSGYFDGGGDYLSVPASAQFLPGANTDFTFEAWVYLTATPSAQGAQVVGTGEYGTNSDWGIAINSSRVPFFYFNVLPSGFFLTSSTAVNLNSWNHIAVTRSGTGANNLKMFLNGVNVSQASRNDTMDYNGNNLSIGADENGDEAVFTGYISGLRLINGTGYTSISVPTAPPTAITNTSLLLNFTNAGIVDGTMKNNLETVGNAQVNTSIVKYGTGSMAFDGTGDYLKGNQATSNLYVFEGNFTIEMWVYSGSFADVGGAFPTIFATSSFSGTGIGVKIQSAGGLGVSGCACVWYNGSQILTGTTSIANSTWTHVAVSRINGFMRLFVNGTQQASTTNTATFTVSSGYPLIGADTTTAGTLNGYIDDLRITKGVARYTANFTPPTVALPRQ